MNQKNIFALNIGKPVYSQMRFSLIIINKQFKKEIQC